MPVGRRLQVSSAKTEGSVALTRVFVDSNELFPFTVMDLVLTLAEDQLIEFVWTEELLDEWERVIVARGKRTKESARSVSAPFGRRSRTRASTLRSIGTRCGPNFLTLTIVFMAQPRLLAPTFC